MPSGHRIAVERECEDLGERRDVLGTSEPNAGRGHLASQIAVFAGLERTLAPLRWLQQGRVQLYVLYIAFTLLVLLVWKLGEA